MKDDIAIFLDHIRPVTDIATSVSAWKLFLGM